MVSGKSRLGVTLLEVICTLAIIALIVGFVLAAIQKVRIEALRVESTNNLRQIALGVHQLADHRMGKIEGLPKASGPIKIVWNEESLFRAILPYTDKTPILNEPASQAEAMDYFFPNVKVYISPADPSLLAIPFLAEMRCKCSYSFNMHAIDGGLSLPISIEDGMSSTICVSEHFFAAPTSVTFLDFTCIFPILSADTPAGRRRATFADAGWNDVVPVTDPNSRITSASIPGMTFQVRPRLSDVDPRVPQTPFHAGLPVALFDGSVRTLSPSINESVFWSLVTRNGREVVGEF